MAKSGKKQKETAPSHDEGRGHTSFRRTKQFDKDVEKLGKLAKAQILAHAQQFEREWQASKSNDDLSPGFNFKQLDARGGQYRVCQVYVGFDHRLAVTFLIGRGTAYWVHAWKKTKMNNRTETDLAKQRAKTLWDELQREGR
jgi:hypothetical protein